MAGGKAAFYLRLSREDGEGESQSIANQRDFLTAYAREKGFQVVAVFVDDGVSGTTFDRRGFRGLLNAIENGEVDTVLTKDLSRLGRDYIQTGHFLERYFPEKGVRYIAVGDNIDTAFGGGDITPFLSVVNDLYARDISKKVRAALDTKKRMGKFIGSMPPYGYLKDPADKNRLTPNPETAPVVRLIFQAYLERASVLGVAKLLTERAVPTPSGKQVWSDAMIRRILTNPTYMGDLTQNRTKKVSYKVRKMISLPAGEWIITPNTHEGLVSRESFADAQRLLRVRNYSRAPHPPRLLSGLVFCGGCGKPMTFQRQGGRLYLVCSTSRRPGGRCASHCYRAEKLESAIKEALREVAAASPGAFDEAARPGKSAAGGDGQKRLEKKLEADRVALAALYRDQANGVIAQEEYQELRGVLQEERVRLESLLTGWHPEKRPSQTVAEFLRFERLERAALLALVERVTVHDDKSIDLVFRFRRPGSMAMFEESPVNKTDYVDEP